MNRKKRIYMDYAASTPVREEVLDAMEPYFSQLFANPSSRHKEGRRAKEALDKSREKVAWQLNCKPSEVIFTGSGTESNNLAILGVYKSLFQRGDSKVHFLTTNIEHSSVESVFSYLEKKEGVEVGRVPVFRSGVLDLEELEKNIQDKTILVSVMYVNNEIGAIQPIKEIGSLIRRLNKGRKRKILFHVDAAQAPLYFSINVEELGVDFMTLDAQKIYGPKGVGVLYVKEGSLLEPIMYGGSQERLLRPATENVPAIVGLAKALELAGKERKAEVERMRELQNFFVDELSKKVPEARINGTMDTRSPNNINISIPNIEGDYLLLLLDEEGVAASAASACHSGKGFASRVVRALVRASGGGESENAIRFSMGKDSTKEDVKKVVEILHEALDNIS